MTCLAVEQTTSGGGGGGARAGERGSREKLGSLGGQSQAVKVVVRAQVGWWVGRHAHTIDPRARDASILFWRNSNWDKGARVAANPMTESGYIIRKQSSSLTVREAQHRDTFTVRSLRLRSDPNSCDPYFEEPWSSRWI